MLPGMVLRKDKSMPFCANILAKCESKHEEPTEIDFLLNLIPEKFLPNRITTPGIPPSLIIKLEHAPMTNIGTSAGRCFRKN